MCKARYGASDRILSVKDESVESSGISTDVYYSYDALGRLLSESNGGRTHFYQYDLANRRVKSFYGGTSSIFESSTFTHTLDYVYNTNGKISTITDQKGRVTSYTYDLNGNVVKKTHANGISYTRSYDALNRLKECNSDDVWFNLKYYYDLNGNIMYLEEKYYINRPEYMMLSNGYDVFDRLTCCSMNDYQCYRILYYSYDKNGNRIGLNQNQYWGTVEGDSYLTEEYDVNSLNQLVNLTRIRLPRQGHLPVGEAEENEVSFIYNSRGNVTRVVDSDGDDISFSYDLFDMLESTTKLGSDESVVRETSNAYDYRGRRISHIENEDETQYSYGDGVSVLETKGAKTTLFYRGSDQGGGVGGINYAEYSDGSELNYKFYNLRGDVIFTLDGERRCSSSTYYYEFGKSEQLSGDIKTDRHRANTKVEDNDNLLNEGKRFRQLEYGIFLTPDPLEYVDGYNLYIYCGRNPWGKWVAELQMNFKNEGVGINDPISGPAPAGYTVKNAEISTNIEITGTGFTPGKIYTLAVEIICRKFHRAG